MLVAVTLQAVITLVAGIIAWLAVGPIQALSLVAGGGSIVIPNGLLAMRLRASHPQTAPVVLLVGEFVKILSSVGLLWLAYRWIEGLSWGALIVGLVLALKALLLTPWVQRAVDQRQAAKAVR